MSGIQSHFIVDIWTSKLLENLLKNTHSNRHRKHSKSIATLDEQQTTGANIDGFDAEVSKSLIGPALWSTDCNLFYSKEESPIYLSPQPEPGEPSASSRRRVNQLTCSGRCSASVLYQELNKFNVDPHRLVTPYDFGEIFGPAEHLQQPYRIEVHPQVGFLCDVHGHLCDAEVIGLLAGKWEPAEQCLYIQAAFPCAATERHEDHGLTDVELDTEAEWKVRQAIEELGLHVIGWYHSHPKFKPDPSVMDIFNQQQYQQFTRDDVSGPPFVGLIVSTFDTHLATAASHHQWFTVVPYSPPVRSNSIVEEDLVGGSAVAGGSRQDRKAHAAGKVDQGTVYMPVRMEVSYSTVVLDSAFSATASSGFVEDDASYADTLLRALENLHVGPELPAEPDTLESGMVEVPAVTPDQSAAADGEKKRRGSTKKTAAGGAAKEVYGSAASEKKPRKGGKAVTKGSIISAADAIANAQATGNNGNASKQVISEELGGAQSDLGVSAAANSLAGSGDEEIFIPGSSVAEFYERAYGDGAQGNFSTVCVPVPNVVPAVDHSTFVAHTAPALAPEIAPEIALETAPQGPSITDADGELARQISAADEAALGKRRPSRDVKKRETFGDFVDTLTVLTGQSLRKQNMEKVKAQELKAKLAAQKAKMKEKNKANENEVEILTKSSAGTAGASKASKGVAKAVGQAGTSMSVKGARPKCDDCVVPAVTDTALCTEIGAKGPKEQKGGKGGKKGEGKKRPRSTTASDTEAKSSAESASSEVASDAPTVFTSTVLALQDPSRACAAIARRMLCAVVPQYRGLVLVVLTLGFYYSRQMRRVDLAKEWRALDKVPMPKIDKLKASAQVWLARLGMKPDGHDSSQEAVKTEGGGELAVSSLTGQTNVLKYKLIELMGQFISACWEDYSKVSRKRKNAQL